MCVCMCVYAVQLGVVRKSQTDTGCKTEPGEAAHRPSTAALSHSLKIALLLSERERSEKESERMWERDREK